ncbi:ribosome biogenesis GTP-binding protein YihA/YsxC [Kyrpidia spormannii]|uniref:ribosome biogenesis GTP-binding protein YihA/YsxC n=1 Tax=Kyrpidia spormannii TaxID=2055160 RepID=UPI0014745DB6|nr:ribosome biogenesis GTP-binding protein YihA/YsxC [Kyrpidia spormannii]
MQVTEAILAGTAVSPDRFPKDGLPEFALVGRSNVGKSSLINRLVMRKKLAHTSNTPGRTRTLNFYRINSRFYLVDLPGYGYAQVSQSERRRWGAMVENFLANRESLAGVIHVVDLRHPPTADDRLMAEWLRVHDLAVLVVATKADKIARSRWDSHRRQVEATLQPSRCVVFSAETGAGRDQVWTWVVERLSGREGHPPS